MGIKTKRPTFIGYRSAKDPWSQLLRDIKASGLNVRQIRLACGLSHGAKCKVCKRAGLEYIGQGLSYCLKCDKVYDELGEFTKLSRMKAHRRTGTKRRYPQQRKRRGA